MKRVTLFLLLISMAFSQAWSQATRTVTGKVTDEQGNPVGAATVQAKGNTKTGTSTGNDGTFRLTVPADVTTLVISSLGYKQAEVRITDQNNITVQLTASADRSLDEVVVTVPYGTVKKTAFTGSEATISAKTLARQQVTSVTRSLEGQVAGIIATNGGGAPGTGATVLIRGVGSVNASSSPLYVVNGIPYDGSIAAIPNDDIESISVLKDAAAAALYGSRAANGVIMITTKRGKKGAPAVTVNVRQGFMSRLIPEYDRVGPKEYYELFWEAYRNQYRDAGGLSEAAAGVAASNVLTSSNGLVYNAYNVPGNQLVDPVTGKLNPNAQLLWNESWEDALYRTASRTHANLSVSGAGERNDYYISVGYLNEEGILKFSGYKRFNGRVNVNTTATNWLNLGLNIDGEVAKRSDVISGGSATSNPFYYTRSMGPIYPVYRHDLVTGAYVDSAGQHLLDWGVPGMMGTRPYAGNSNLLGSLALDDRSRNITNVNANTYAEIKFTKDLSLKTTIGGNLFEQNITSYQNNQYGDAAPSGGLANGGRSTKTWDRQLSYTANEVLSWNKHFGEHNIKALAGHEDYLYRYNYFSAAKQGFQFPGQSELDNGGSTLGLPSSYQIDHRIESYFTGVNYDYRGKYLASGSFRTDGSSRFRDSVRWGQFYSVGLGWVISKEDFLKANWISQLKIRANYGEQGNENIGEYYPYESYYYANGDGTYVAPSRPAATNLMWETNKSFDVGVDFSLFKNRLQGTVDYFNRASSNLLFDVPLPISTGYASALRNVGSMKNYGWELTLGFNAVNHKNFDWRIDGNITSFKNRITKLFGKAETEGIINGSKKLLPGHGIFDFFIPEWAGVDPATGNNLYYKDILDANGKSTGQRTVTDIYNSATSYYVASALPKFSGGLTNSLRLKNFELSVLTSFAYGGKFLDYNYQGLMHRGDAGFAWSTDILKRWQKPGDVTNVPRLQSALSGNEGTSTRFLLDASYLNIKNITLSYTLSAPVLNRLHLAGLQVYGNIDNVFVFTAKKGMDPQRSFTGTADETYTPYRTVTFGFTANLK